MKKLILLTCVFFCLNLKAQIFVNPKSGGLDSTKVPLSGTTKTKPITGTLEYRGATGSTFFVDTLHSFEFGYGNRKNLQIATIKSSILYGNGNFVINNNNLNSQSYIQMQPGLFVYSAQGNGTTVKDTSEVDFSITGISIQGNDSLYFKGINLLNNGVSTPDRMLAIINKNKDAYTYLPKQISDSLYLAITSNVTINGVTKNLKTNPTFSISAGGSNYSFTTPLVATGTVVSIPLATNSVNGYLSSVDRTTFSGKQNALSGNGYVFQNGSVTSYTTTIPNASLSNSTISGVPLGNTLFNQTVGYGLIGAPYNGSATQNEIVDSTIIVSKPYVTAKLLGKQNTLTAGTGIAISGNTITATGATVNTGTINQVVGYIGANTIGGSNNFKFSPSSLNFNVGNRLPLWAGTTINPVTSFIKDTAGTNFFTIENNDTSTNSRVGFAVVGARSNFTPNIARYAQFTLFSPSYTAVPFFQNKLIVASGGNASGTLIYSDQGNIQLTTNRTISGVFNPDLVIQGANTPGGAATGFIGINTATPQARLDVFGNFRCTANIVGSNSNIPFTDVNGVSNPNPNVLVNYNDGSGVIFNLSVQEKTGSFGWTQNYNSTSTGSSCFLSGSYAASVFGAMRTFNSGYSSSYPYEAASTLVYSVGGKLNVGTANNFPLTFFTNSTQVGGFSTTGAFNATGSITGTSLIKTGGTNSQILAADGSVITAGGNITISGGLINAVNIPTVKNSISLLSQNTATTVSTYTTASGGMFEVAGFITVNAIATDVINFQITFTDTHGLKTVTYQSVSTPGYNSDAKATFVAVAGSVITVSTILTTSVGTINYDVGATIIKVQ